MKEFLHFFFNFVYFTLQKSFNTLNLQLELKSSINHHNKKHIALTKNHIYIYKKSFCNRESLSLREMLKEIMIAETDNNYNTQYMYI